MMHSTGFLGAIGEKIAQLCGPQRISAMSGFRMTFQTQSGAELGREPQRRTPHVEVNMFGNAARIACMSLRGAQKKPR